MDSLKIRGEVYTDHLQRSIYSTDASMYQILPDIIAIPMDEEDLGAIFRYATKNNMPILARGSATSLAGQTVNRGIMVDFTKYFNNIVYYDAQERVVIVQPGVTRDQLNAHIAIDKLHFAPDPATSNRATIGGMIANNSSGTKSILYGKTSDYVRRLKIMLTDGTIVYLENHDLAQVDKIIEENVPLSPIYKILREQVFQNAAEIKTNYPKVMRRVTGYALDAFVDNEQWNLCKLIAGSEGSLAIILEAEIGLTPLPRFQNMVVAHFTSRTKGIEAVKTIVDFGPAAVEVLDYNVLHQSKQNAITRAYHTNLIQGEPDIVLTIEFYGDSESEIAHKAQMVVDFLDTYPTAYHHPVFTDMARINDALNLRKDGLGILMGKVADRMPQAFIEDSAIPLEYLAEYVDAIEKVCTDKGVEIVLYAHASVGVLHIRPYLDVTDQGDIELMKYISDQCFQLVKKYGGSWSGEHGDGRNRGPRIKDYYGETIYESFRKIKKAFDPQGLLNPNIIIDTPPMDQNMRYGPSYEDQKYDFQFKYRHDHSFQDLVHMCSGVGACRKNIGGTMCPSFRATGDEKDSTRGRANTLRLAMSGQYEFGNLLNPEVKEVLDLCLSCKACKSECPSNVDMAKLKSEVLHLHHEAHGPSLAEKLVKWAPGISKMAAGVAAPSINWLQKSGLGKSMLRKFGGISPERSLPDFASQSLASWYKNQNTFQAEHKVVLFADTYINYHETALGKKAIELLQSCGYEVILADVGCCQRPLISNGFLKDAKIEGTKTAEKLAPFYELEYPVLVVEPSCHSALAEDLPDLIDDDVLANNMNKKILTVESFLLREWEAGRLKGQFVAKQELHIHGHCHQKSVGNMEDLTKLLKGNNISHEVLDTGCCGMAGAFGYEEKHLAVSKAVAADRLIPAIENLHGHGDIVACGTSCRHQIKDLTTKTSSHILALIEFVPS